MNIKNLITAYLLAIIIGIIFKEGLQSPIWGLAVIATIPFIMRRLGYGITNIGDPNA